jgi:hypothetical protein
MENITDKHTADRLIARINALQQSSPPQWGKMNVYQMLKHLSKWEEMAMNKTLYKQAFIGKIFGKIALKGMLKEGPVKQNMPTVSGFEMTGDGNIDPEREKLIALLKEHVQYDQGFLHPFFGKLNAEQAGQLDYKHFDHHLRQFGV